MIIEFKIVKFEAVYLTVYHLLNITILFERILEYRLNYYK